MMFSYARVSTVEQAADGAISIAEQHRKNRALATMRGVSSDDLAECTDGGISGSISLSERPAGGEMLSSVRSGDCIVACKLDRLFRSASDALVTAEALKKQGVDLILIDLGVDPVTSNGAAKMFFGVLALMAEFERDRIRERTEEGRKGKRARKGYMGGPVPFGFKVDGKGRDAVLVEDQREQEIVKVVRSMHGNHKSSRIARYLTTQYPTRSGKPWQRIQVERILAAH